MKKIFHNGAAEIAPRLQTTNAGIFSLYLGVYHPNKLTKIRGVFDSSESFEGVSLNSVMMSGPDLTNNLLGILLRSRRDLFAVTADEEQMFYQFFVKEEDCNFLRFFLVPGQ